MDEWAGEIKFKAQWKPLDEESTFYGEIGDCVGCGEHVTCLKFYNLSIEMEPPEICEKCVSKIFKATNKYYRERR